MTDAQPRRYHLRVFAPDGEIHGGRQYMVVLDLTPGPGLRLAKSELDTLLHTLAADDDPAADVGGYHLAVYDFDTGGFQFHWRAR